MYIYIYIYIHMCMYIPVGISTSEILSVGISHKCIKSPLIAFSLEAINTLLFFAIESGYIVPIYICICMHSYTYIYEYTYIYMNTHTCIYIYYMYIYMYIYMDKFMFIYRENQDISHLSSTVLYVPYNLSVIQFSEIFYVFQY
jgi:hypothetical protein